MRFLEVGIVNFEDANLLNLAMQRVCLFVEAHIGS
jgi:hypothetical protein